MPMYDYRCGACHREFETVQAVVDRHQAKCPACSCESFLIIKRVTPFILGQGRSHSGVVEWKEREKARLTKRSVDYDRSPRGRAEREESLHRQAKRGHI